ncbi:unnamed protein product, partial [Rotaria sp. Silwood1]
MFFMNILLYHLFIPLGLRQRFYRRAAASSSSSSQEITSK